MKKLLLSLVILGITVNAYALFDYEDNSNTNTQGQVQGQITDVDNKNINKNTNQNYNTNFNSQGQNQGQNQGQAQVMGQAQKGEVKNDIEIDGDKTEVNSISFANMPNQKGQSNLSLQSPWGAAAVSQTERYQMVIEKIGVISAIYEAGFLTAEEAKAEVAEAFQQLKNMTKEERFLGIFWRTSGGRNIMNGLGLLDW